MRLSISVARTIAAGLLAATVFGAAPVMAHDTTVGELTVTQPHARPNLPNRPTAAYLTISNHGASADRLISVMSESFGAIELHTVREHDGVMHMMQVDGIVVPADAQVMLEPGGFHLMMFDAVQRFKIGDSFTATLTFERGGDVTVMFMVQRPKPGGGKMDHSDHSDGHSRHSLGSGN